MTKTVLLITLAFLALCHSAWPVPATPCEQIGDLLISPSAVQTTKTDGRYTAPPGFYYVRVAVAVRNVGDKAICTYLSAHLGTSLSGGRKLGSMTLKARNGAQTVIGGSINQLLPGEDAEGYIMFHDLRDGIEPESLSIESDQQSCAKDLHQLEPITFTITNTQHGLTIASKTYPQSQLVTPTPSPSEAAKPASPTTEPIAIATPDATYTDDARRARLEGEVQFRVTVGTDGQLHDIQPLNHLGMGLDEQAVAALQEWRFKPAIKGGKPVPQMITIDMSFRLIH